MGQNAIFDPEKKDYASVQGSVVSGDRIEEAVYFVLTIPRGRWMYALPGQGSELHEFKRAKRTQDTEQLFAARVQEPIRTQLIETGRATASAVVSLEQTRTGTSNQIQVEPASKQLSAQLQFTPL